MNSLCFDEITYADPVRLFQPFADCEGSVLLHSAKRMTQLGRYSYFGVDPFKILRLESAAVLDVLNELAHELNSFTLDPIDGLPPFQGGVLGFLSYELLGQLERVPRAKLDDQQLPLVALGFYDLVVAFDHELEKAWIISSGLPQTDPVQQNVRAKERCAWLLSQIENHQDPIDYGYSLVRDADIRSNFSPEQYHSTIQRTIDYIMAGDIFEANIAQRFCAKMPDDLSAWQLFTRSCQINPATFASFVNFGDCQLASASPERFIKVQNNRVECRPIKGTRPRSVDPNEDLRLADELCASVKDRAENIMIVDLMRNDIARVCLDESVNVTQLCGLESYATVHHLVSVVEGELSKNASIVDLLRATFPGGSITGAPKIRCMEIIAELEPHVRSAYCGNVVCIGFDGYFDSSIIIRTFVICKGLVSFHAGGAIVADSDPAAEYQESLDKAGALRKALTQTFGAKERKEGVRE